MATPVEWLNEFKVNTGAADTPGTSDPQVVGLSNGNYLVAWTESGTTGVGTSAGNDIVGRIYDPEGNPVGSAFRINTSFSIDDEDDFDIAATNDGGFIMVYVDDDISTPGVEAIRWERFDDTGSQTDFLTIATNGVSADVLSNPKVVVNNNNNSSYVTFTDNVGAGVDEIRAVRVDAAGSIVTAEFDAAINLSGEFSRDADAAINTNGELVTVYEEDDLSGNVSIELFIANTAGVQQHRINVDTGTVVGSDPQVATLTNGNIAVTWVEGGDVYYAVYNSNAVLVKAKASVTSLTQLTNEPSIAALPQGGFVIVYDNDTTGTGFVQARRFNNDGTNDPTDSYFTVRAGGTEVSPSVAATLDGRVTFTWSEGGDVYNSIWDTRGDNIDSADFAALPLNFVENGPTTTNVIDTTLTGDGGSDELLGQGGDDLIIGGSGVDTITGGGGNDTIEGGFTQDEVDGGSGNDLFIVRNGEFADNIVGGSGSDTLDLSNRNDFAANVDTKAGTYDNQNSGNTITSVETIIGTQLNDTLAGSTGVTLNGDLGDDLILFRIGDGLPDFDGGAGTDTADFTDITSSIFADLTGGGYRFGTTLPGTFSGDLLNFENYEGSSGSDNVIGTSGNNVINTGNGNDTVDGGGGADTITTGAGNDFIDAGGPAAGQVVDGGSGNDTIVANNNADETLDGGTGIDLLDTRKFNGNYNVNLATGVTNFAPESFTNFENIIMGDGDDTVTGTGIANDIATGLGNDLVNAGSGNDTVNGGLGTDSILGQGGNDLLNGEGGNDTLFGGAGTDTLNGGDGADRLFGEGSADVINGEDGNDNISGGSGNDTIDGGDDDDFVQGQGNNDVISGGAGSDTILGQAGLDQIFGGSGDDSLNGGGAADTISGSFGNDTIDGGTERDLLDGGSGNDLMFGGGGKDTMTGGANDDTMDGGTDTDIVDGGNGNDDISGGGGNDTLDGGAGGDTVDGGSGMDLILVAAGEGGDVLFGGTAADTFDFESGFGAVKIEDFSTAGDVVDLQDVTTVSSFGDLVINYGGGGTNATVELGGGDEIIFNNLGAALNAGDFIF